MNRFKEDSTKLSIFLAEQQLMQQIQYHLDTLTPNRVVYKIPVVFMCSTMEGENISRTQIEDAVSILNQGFRLQNTDANNVQSTFTGMPADVEVEFELATKAPNGQCFSGITRTLSLYQTMAVMELIKYLLLLLEIMYIIMLGRVINI